ncbi:hypothetical protein Glove_110g32 [Diversispora epigaea]|uniref:DUF659 domain-containing protein n=1 Tax=Diversispora epigaea TaxID=1348612 RepID=A0A397J4A0_9GLOM|nr:hypothetical protein Glove_110g32 [Diversispora epigaea]
MAPLPFLLEEYIIKTDEKINKCNVKVYCKPCIKSLGDIEGRKNWFPNKKDRIIAHFKKCKNFLNETTPEKREEIFNLQNNNNTNNNNLNINKRKETSFTSETSSSKVIIRSSSYGVMDNYIVRPLSVADMKKFHTLLLQLSLSCGWAFNWINKPETEELFTFLNPFLKLPDRRLLGGRILNEAVNDSNSWMIKNLQEDQIGVTVTFDGWTNVRNEHIMGIVIITSEGHPYVWKAIDISSEHETHIEVMEKTNTILEELNNNSIKVCALVTDSAGAYAASRRRLRISKKSIVFFPCFAHQLNLCVGEVFKESTEFKTTLDKAIRLASFFRNSNNKFFISKLKEIQYEEYNKESTIVSPGETRWNSYYYVCTSLIKTQKALHSDKARLHEVIQGLAYIIQIWNNFSDEYLAAKLIARIERRWKEWEQPILILSCILHPEYRLKLFNNRNINYVTKGSWLGYYYHVWTGKHATSILKELDNYRLEVYPFDSITWNQFNNDIYRYWCFLSASTNELGFVACRIFGICVNAASVERLWSCMGFIHSNRRNRLSISKVLNMSKLRADITYNHRRQEKTPIVTVQTIIAELESLKYNETLQDNTIDNTINNTIDNTDLTDNENFEVIDSSQESEEEIDEDTNSGDFGNYLQEWISMLEDETETFIDLEENENEELENIIHPAINANAKWELLSLFKELNSPL